VSRSIANLDEMLETFGIDSLVSRSHLSLSIRSEVYTERYKRIFSLLKLIDEAFRAPKEVKGGFRYSFVRHRSIHFDPHL
jgi:hypothetical protein